MNTTPEIPKLSDFPKIYCPFVRRLFDVNVDQWKSEGAKLGMRQPMAYLVIDKVSEGYEWVFDDPDTIAVEKLNGSNVKVQTEKGRLLAVQNRLNVIDPLQVMKGKIFIMDGIFRAIEKGYLKEDGEQVGELIGPKLQGNPYKLDSHEWYPFEKAVKDLSYRSFHEHDRNFQNWSEWFKTNLWSRYYTKRASKLGIDDRVFAEGVIFYNLKRKAEKKSWMAKLRRDMFDWFYSDKMEVFGYDPKNGGRSPSETSDWD